MAQYVFTMQGVTKTVPGNRTILENIWLSFFPGAKIGVLGLNGAGKSSLLRIMAGEDREFDGEARPQKGIKIGFLPQEPRLNADKDVRGNVEEGVAETKALLEEFDKISERFAEPMSDDEMNELLERQGELQTKIDAANAWELDRTLDIAADALRLPSWDADVNKLSGGEKRRVALCKLLLSAPDMLLLDEPTNHLDAESVAWLERFLAEYPGTVVAVTHDRYFLDNVAGWILELDRGRGIPFEGNYTAWLEAKEKRLEAEASQERARQRAIKSELEWVRSNPKGRQAKSKARLQRFEELNSKDFQTRNETTELYIPPGPRLGDKVIDIEHLGKGYDDRLLIDDLSCSIPKGAIVGIIGRNGAGKTTLMRSIMGLIRAEAGHIAFDGRDLAASPAHLRARLGIGYMPEDRRLVPQLTVADNILLPAWAAGRSDAEARLAWLYARMPEVERLAARRAEQLSGGQQKLVALARALMTGHRLLLLDEPFEGVAPALAGRLADVVASLKGENLSILLSESDYTHSTRLVDRLFVIERGVVEERRVSGQG
jgi:energy-dependent translational throttle protein EttA